MRQSGRAIRWSDCLFTCLKTCLMFVSQHHMLVLLWCVYKQSCASVSLDSAVGHTDAHLAQFTQLTVHISSDTANYEF